MYNCNNCEKINTKECQFNVNVETSSEDEIERGCFEHSDIDFMCENIKNYETEVYEKQ